MLINCRLNPLSCYGRFHFPYAYSPSLSSTSGGDETRKRSFVTVSHHTHTRSSLRSPAVVYSRGMKFLSLQSSTHTIDPFPPLLLLLIPLLLFPGRSTPRGPTSFPLPSSVQQSSRGGGIIILAMLPVDLSRTHHHYTHARTRSVCVCTST